MRKTVIILSIFVLITSGCESFRTLDTKEFNDKIANRTDIKTPDELIKLYYDYDCSQDEGNPTITIHTIDLGKNRYEVTLIHEGLLDDSLSGWKVVMIAQRAGTTWIVTEIKENWKCWEDRGHTNWGTKRCT